MIPELAKSQYLEKIAMSVYNNSPYFLQNLAVSGYGYFYRKKSLNKHVLSCLNKLEKTQWYSKFDLEKYQNKKLKMLMTHAYENVPYYHKIFRENKLTPNDIKTKDDLVKLPYLTKDDIRGNFQSLIAKNHRIDQLQLVHTSGTTGSPLEFYWDNNVQIMENAFIRRHWGWAGFGINDTRITLRGNVIVPLSQKKKPYWRYNLSEKQIFFSSYHMSDKTLGQYLNKIVEISPKAIQGHPSAIYTLAKYMFENDIIIPVDLIFTSSEPLYDIQIDVIEKQFQSKIYDLYGLSERTVAAGQCSEGNYHIFSEYGIVELSKDSEIILDDGSGEIIATGLNNYGMPLIRYKTGDVTKFVNDSCECGRHFTLMEPIKTKLRDVIVTGDGLILPPTTLSHVLQNRANIEKSQIVQESKNKLKIKIIKRPGYSEKDTNLIFNELISIVGPNTNIEFEFVNDIPLTKAGKYRFIISKITHDFKID